MMSPKQFLALLCFYMSYLFFGASVYYTLEQELETADREEKLQKRLDIYAYLVDRLTESNENVTEVKEVLERVSSYCMFPVTHPDSDEYETPYIWTFYHSFYFVFTVVSTVGYGNISPNSTFGRMFMILYAIIGLPLNAIMFANLGEIFATTFEKLYRRYKNYKMSMNKNYVALRLSLIAQVFLYLVPGILIFIFLPACVFTYFEKWPYEVSVYYSFVTLTTIGFGDYAASFQPTQPREFGNLFVAYEAFIIIWFILGLGYLVMIMGYLIKAYKSKRMMQLEHHLSLGIKDAQTRIWSGVTHDINYLRKIMNEISFARVQPVYVDECNKFATLGQKSSSCPDLTLYREEEEPKSARRYKRALSECPGIAEGDPRVRTSSIISINRTQSDSDLRKIDRKRTFAGINTVEPSDILAKVASALGQLRPEEDLEDDRGVHGFSDSQILASEQTWGGWSNVNERRQKQRLRATSETKLPPSDDTSNNAYEWTWSGANNQIADLRDLRQKSRYNDLYRSSFSSAVARKRRQSEDPSGCGSTVIAMPPSPETTITSQGGRFMGRFNNMFNRKRTMSTSSGIRQQLPSNIHEDAIKYIKATSSDYPTDPRFLNTSTYTGGNPPGRTSRRGSIFESLQSENSQILENTTIADLIKVLEAVHTQANLPEGLPRRKMGTASLTPPEMPSLFPMFDPTPDPRTYQTFNAPMSRRGSMFPSLGGSLGGGGSGLGSGNAPSSRRGSLMPPSMSSGKAQPPPYSALDIPMTQAKRRFSVRPAVQISASSVSSLSSNSSVQQIPPVTRKLSLRPSPLAREPATSSFRDVGRFAKPKSLAREVTSHNARQRHGSLSHLPERPLEKKRYDSK